VAVTDGDSVSRQELAEELGLPVEFLDEEQLSDEERLKRIKAQLSALDHLVEADMADVADVLDMLRTARGVGYRPEPPPS
jgi:hypothetical protein